MPWWEMAGRACVICDAYLRNGIDGQTDLDPENDTPRHATPRRLIELSLRPATPPIESSAGRPG